jgi:hypothetical protein
MKRFLLALALVAVAGATYVATAPGSQTAGPTAKQFKALQKQVTKLSKDEKLVKNLAVAEAGLLSACMVHAVPINQFGEGDGFSSTFGYSWTDPDMNSGTPWLETALDVTANDDANALWITGGTESSGCGADLLGSRLRTAARLAGVHLHAAPRTFHFGGAQH